MAVIDVNGRNIVHHEEFPDDSNVNNLEIGAGKSAFGKKFFPNCYLTEQEDSVVSRLTHFSEFDDYDEDSNMCHFIDNFKNLEELARIDRKFDRIICCNPYGYGFGNPLHTIEILNCFGKLLNSGGQVLIIGSYINKWSKRNKLVKFYNEANGEIEYSFSISDEYILDSTHAYISKHKYYKTCMKGTTTPNFLFTLTKN